MYQTEHITSSSSFSPLSWGSPPWPCLFSPWLCCHVWQTDRTTSMNLESWNLSKTDVNRHLNLTFGEQSLLMFCSWFVNLALSPPENLSYKWTVTTGSLGLSDYYQSLVFSQVLQEQSEGFHIGYALWAVLGPYAVFTYTHSSISYNNGDGGVLGNEAFRSSPWPIGLQWAVAAQMQIVGQNVFITSLLAASTGLEMTLLRAYF